MVSKAVMKERSTDYVDSATKELTAIRDELAAPKVTPGTLGRLDGVRETLDLIEKDARVLVREDE